MVRWGIDLVAFDLSGTTLLDRGEVLRALAEALSREKASFTEAELQQKRGLAKPEALRFFIARQYGDTDPENPARVERAYRAFRARLDREYASGVPAVPGAAETLHWLKDNGVRVAFTTGFYHEVAGPLIRAAGWEALMDACVCSDDVPRGRPAPYMLFRVMEATGVKDVRRLVAVGDTPADLQAGWNAGAGGVVGVLTGGQPRTVLEAGPHTAILESVASLPELFTNGTIR